MIGGGGERVTLRIVAKHADHWNVWGGPKVLARKSAILEEQCSKIGRDSKSIARSVNMSLLITDKRDEIDRLAETIAKRMGLHVVDARDTCLAGTPDQIREQLRELKAAGATTLFIPTLFRLVDELRRDMDQFITEIAPPSGSGFRCVRIALHSAGIKHLMGVELTMPLAITSRIVSEVVIIDLSGRLCFLQSGLREQINELLDELHRDFILNLAGVPYIDSSGLGQLVSIWSSIRSHGGHMILLRPTDRIRELFHITKLDTVFEIFHDEVQAVRQIRKALAALA